MLRSVTPGAQHAGRLASGTEHHPCREQEADSSGSDGGGTHQASLLGQQAGSAQQPVRPPGAGDKPAETVLADLGLAGQVAQLAQQRAQRLESRSSSSGSGRRGVGVGSSSSRGPPTPPAGQPGASRLAGRQPSPPGAGTRPAETVLADLGLASQVAQLAQQRAQRAEQQGETAVGGSARAHGQEAGQQHQTGLSPSGQQVRRPQSPLGAGTMPAETLLADLGLTGQAVLRARQRALHLVPPGAAGSPAGSAAALSRTGSGAVSLGDEVEVQPAGGILAAAATEQAAALAVAGRQAGSSGSGSSSSREAPASPGTPQPAGMQRAGLPQGTPGTMQPAALAGTVAAAGSRDGSAAAAAVAAVDLGDILQQRLAWCLHLLLCAVVGLLTGTLAGSEGVTAVSLARRTLAFASAGAACNLAGAAAAHARSVISNTPDEGAVHAQLASCERLRSHAAAIGQHARLELPGRLALLMLQASLFLPLLMLHGLLPSAAGALEVFRAGEQQSNLSQAIHSIDDGSFPEGSLAAPGHRLPDGSSLRDALVHMRQEEARSQRLTLEGPQQAAGSGSRSGEAPPVFEDQQG